MVYPCVEGVAWVSEERHAVYINHQEAASMVVGWLMIMFEDSIHIKPQIMSSPAQNTYAWMLSGCQQGGMEMEGVGST
jgi:hypothetical protein